MRLRKDLKEHSFTAFINEVEKRAAGDWPDRLLKITSNNGRPAAICLISPELSCDARDLMVKLFADYSSLKRDSQKRPDSIDILASPPKPKGLFMDHERFMIDLAAVTVDSAKSRVPFAVLLVRADGDFLPFAKMIAEKLDSEYSIYMYGPLASDNEGYLYSATVALILPATGLKRARQIAEKVNDLGGPKETSSIGVGASSFGSKLSQEDFLLQIEESLEAASKVGNVVRWNVGGSNETCQVTAEERRQLFSSLSLNY